MRRVAPNNHLCNFLGVGCEANTDTNDLHGNSFDFNSRRNHSLVMMGCKSLQRKMRSEGIALLVLKCTLACVKGGELQHCTLRSIKCQQRTNYMHEKGPQGIRFLPFLAGGLVSLALAVKAAMARLGSPRRDLFLRRTSSAARGLALIKHKNISGHIQIVSVFSILHLKISVLGSLCLGYVTQTLVINGLKPQYKNNPH